MYTASLAIAVVLALMVTMSGVMKVRRNPAIVKAIHEVVGVPLQYLPVLAALEFAGGLGLIVGLWIPAIGLAAACGLVIYFVGAVVSHVRVRDFQGISGAVLMLVLSVVALATRVV